MEIVKTIHPSIHCEGWLRIMEPALREARGARRAAIREVANHMRQCIAEGMTYTSSCPEPLPDGRCSGPHER